MDDGYHSDLSTKSLLGVKPIESSLESLTFRASFLKRSHNGNDLRCVLLSTERVSLTNARLDSHQPPHSFGISLRPPRKDLKFYLFIFLLTAAFIVMICLTAIGFGERKHCLYRANSPGAGDPNPDSDPTFIPPREIFTSSEYRANWSNPHSGVPQVAFDVIAPIDAINGRGHGWTVFFTHGLGAMNASDGYRWRDFLLSTYSDPVTGNSVGNLTGLNFIFPKAPVRPITVYAAQTNQGARPGWFDIKDWRDLHYLEDEEGLRQSAIGLASILNNEALAGKIQLNQTIIAGFSQGSVMSLLLTLTLPQPPAACIMLSGYLPLPLRLIDLRSPSLAGYKKTSFYWLHGTDDPILIYNQARAGMKLFSSLFADRFLRGKFKTFQGLKHGFNPAEQKVVTNYIDGMVSRNSGGIIDSTFDALVEPENEGDVIQFTTP
ncbi:hypothetical protein MJO28_014466 [Puccinia striiformis f. sp. tritici]|uniref:Acyl-protein thioesterase 1 n=3 Tax=Puccinia striiformis TaxID=27350 RepID=A0A0L0V4K0_9BASI|nr:hypothetical protein Pst134EA_026945 [Puccinia striiformis f. sp. tritici]KNE94223.1 hypothetical protein PSTG_12451 [Puccinia striiformis f. sp. tritici PST-78]POV94298.1 hypothetical protein PSTT_16930 [Puccinia striiformis]KAH9450237.1 hypothetical protein Pst134EA_026945 [Puccinia striiformis f. sp. tritici]KAI7938887.1 hypothetical protein MJO28_014466 [Puccinia striiformis f. sp. tritici]KAI7939595.1 hypothetical protein MJO29_014331 [Puccinia striiformis f. sp. tritici]